MESFHKTRWDGFWQRSLLVCLGGQWLSCSPSDFDELTYQSDDIAKCAEAECLDGGQEDDPDVDPSSSEPDGAMVDAGVEDPELESEDATIEEPEPEGEDATIEEPADADASDDQEASLAAVTQAPDAGAPLPSPACGGNPPACRANELEHQMGSCGNCGLGVRSRTRTCAADGCAWGAWSAWSACSDPKTECDPNAAAQTQTVSCTTCGTKTQSRTCSRDTCTWGPWSDTSACTWCEQCAEVVYCDTPASIANRGTWCRQKACSRQQALGDCMDDIQTVCGATTQPFYMEYQ